MDAGGFGDFSSNADKTDMLMRDSYTDQLEIHDISDNAVTSAATIGQVGLAWQCAGIGIDPPAGSLSASTALLIQAMATGVHRRLSQLPRVASDPHGRSGS